MEFLGIGPLELIFVVILALIIFGPNDMIKAGKTIGRVLRSIVTSPNWRAIQQTSKEIRNFPNKLMREAGIEDLQKELPNPETIRKELGVDEIQNDVQGMRDSLSEWTTPPTIGDPSKSSSQGSGEPAQSQPKPDPK
jgi:Sec-independent protein translocase protein TatA